MKMKIIKTASIDDYQTLLEICIESIRSTHSFITKEKLEEYRNVIIEKSFPLANLSYIIEKDEIVGFIATANSKLKMLFISPKHFKKGFGKILIEYAIENFNVEFVDVNEQNEKAHQFYEYMGFEVFKRSPLDSNSDPFPILHMRLKK